METNLEARFKRGGSKGRGRCKRRGILPPTGLTQNTAMEKVLTSLAQNTEMEKDLTSLAQNTEIEKDLTR